jgi:hypothetical protein
MAFDHELVEAQLALQRIGTTDMPKLAWEALEAGRDGPATRRLAALHFPTVFELREVLPEVMREWGMAHLSSKEAAVRLAKLRAREILRSGDDPLKHANDFLGLWVEANYCRELSEYGELDEEVYLARVSGETDDQIRAWLVEKLKTLAAI